MRLMICMVGAALVAGCGQSDSDVDMRNASVSDVANEVADAADSGEMIRPGKWETTTTIESFDAPGMPPQVREAMRQANQPTTDSNCVTEEDVKNPRGKMFTGADKSCRYDRFTMGGGKIDATMTCTADGGSQTARLEGSYSANRYTMKMSSQVRGGESGDATMVMRIDAKRVGQCTAEELAEAAADDSAGQGQ